jgi:hypothetical protein
MVDANDVTTITAQVREQKYSRATFPGADLEDTWFLGLNVWE